MTTPLASKDRSAQLQRLSSERFDLLVIGGGITGAGVAREAALRGLSVALIDGEDFAAGTSSRSTKLIHGGLRYLAMGDFALVREAARERKAVYAMAPHLAEPRWMMLPVASRPALWKYRTGVALYERLGAVAPQDRHQIWGEAELEAEEPRLNRKAFPLACAYREYLTDDARLVLAVLRAAAESGAALANYVKAEKLLWTAQGGRVNGAEVACALTGERFPIRARAVVNAAGPWVEQLAAEDPAPTKKALHLSKGVHIVLPRKALPVQHLSFLETQDKRLIFTVPYLDTVFVGTTDTSYDGADPLWPEILREEATYLLEPLKRYYTDAALTPEAVVGAWAGVRPLIAEAGKSAKATSRKDEVWVGRGGLVTVAGGKLTGFRKMAESVLEAVEGATDLTLAPAPGPTALPGAGAPIPTLVARLPREGNLSEASAQRLARLYGEEGSKVLALGPAPLAGGAVLEGEVRWALAEETPQRLEDLIYRRLRAAWFAPEERDRLLVPAAALMGEALGWSTERQAQEVAQTKARIAQELAFKGLEAVPRAVA